MKEAKLPTRIIDIGLHASAKPVLRLSSGEYGRYVALSHCWGGGSSLTVTQDNLDSLSKAIPTERAPSNFKDAMIITRQLGLQYLWIDSLCILQDSAIDWEREAAKMSDVYRNATLTIAASAAPNTKAGILNRFQWSPFRSLKYHCRITMDTSESSKVYLSRRLTDHDEEEFADCFRKLPLATRGWVLQEQILSPRTLFYGERAIYWYCRSSHQSADGASDTIFLAGTLSDEIPPIFLDYRGLTRALEVAEKRNVYYYWLGIVETYSLRQLTKESDKLPALSGLAAETHRLTGARYLAGIWSEDMINGLLWYPTNREQKPIKFGRGPSWSWPNTNEELKFATRHYNWVDSIYSVKIDAADVFPLGQNPFGTVQSGFVQLTGLTFDICRSRKQYYSSDPASYLYDWLWKDSTENGPFKFLEEDKMFFPSEIPSEIQISKFPVNEVIDDTTVESDWFLAVYLGTWAAPKRTNSLDQTLPHLLDDVLWAYALLLTPLAPSLSEKKATYQRVGFLQLTLPITHVPAEDAFYRQSVKIV